MTRKDDLETSIRESYDLVRQYEELIKTSREPLDIKRWQGEISRQWELIRSWLDEYTALPGGADRPPDIAAIAAHFAARPQRAVPPMAPEPSPPSADYSIPAIRKLLDETFSGETLISFCQEHFPRVYEDWTPGMSKGWVITRLLDHCKRHDRMRELLSKVEEFKKKE
jgi:hypothetical protein